MGDPGWNGLSRRALIGASGAVIAVGGAAFALRGSGRGRSTGLYDAHTLNRGNGAEPDTLDPQLASTQYENNIIGDMFLGLMTEDAHGNPVPGAALDYSASGDGLVYTFNLREHVWSDGAPVTAHDYVFSYRRMLEPKTAAQYAAILYPIRNALAVNGEKLAAHELGVRAIDDRTLQIEFHIQVPYVRQLFSHISTFAVPQHAVERFGDQWLAPQNAVTNGAYVLKEWVPNDHILIVKNPRFYDAKNVAIERIYLYPTQDYSAALKRFRAGELDVQIGVPSQEIGWLRSNLHGALRVAPYMATQYLLFNVGQKPFDDRRVRTALSLAIDREIMAARVMQAGEHPAYAFVPPNMPDYPGRAEIGFRSTPMTARIARARALLREAGYGPGNPLAFDFNIADTSDARLASVAMQSMWKEIGADVRIAPSDEKNHYNLLLRRAFGVAWAGWVADYRDAKDYLFLCQTSSRDLNNGGYSNPKFDALMEQSDLEADPTRRGLLLQQAEQIMLDDVALAPVLFQVSRNLVSPAVRGWIPNDININRTRYLSLDRGRMIA
jgi:oligopeptide transport system substrate-binding protein